MIRKTTATVALATAGLIALPSAAWADNINDSIEGSATVTLTDANPSGSFTVKIAPVNASGEDAGCNIDAGEYLDVKLTAPAGFTLSSADADFTAATRTMRFHAGECNDNKSVTVTRGAGAVDAAGNAVTVESWSGTAADASNELYTNNVNVPLVLDNDGDGIRNSTDPTPNGVVVTPVEEEEETTPPPPAPDADGDGVPDAQDSNSYAPAVGTAADDAHGTEGQTLVVTGSFSDQDPNTDLIITADNTVGTFTDLGNSWRWELATKDDVAQASVTVTASDGEHTNATDDFTYSAANVNPVITGVAQTRVNNCAVTLVPAFTDAGSADTHTESVVWSDGSTALARTFTTAGTYAAEVTVTDDDLASDSEPVTGVRAYNTASAIMQPINSTGTRSGFKIGSTIPVKITVTGCDGAAVSTLSPSVQLEHNDTTTDVAVNESSSTEVATNGKLMRWDGTQYIYNLSTKLSQFTGAALTEGTWTVSVSDPSFAAPVKAAFDLRK